MLNIHVAGLASRSVREILRASFLFVIFSLPFHVQAFTVAPSVTYSGGGYSGFSSYQALATQILAGVMSGVDGCTTAGVGPGAYAITSQSDILITYSRTCTNGSFANFSVPVTASTNSCPPSTVLSGTVCTDAKDAAGACVPGAKDTGMIPYAGNEGLGNALVSASTLAQVPLAQMNGCGYWIIRGSDTCSLNGARAWCVELHSTGDAAGSTDKPLLSTAGTPGTGVPTEPDKSCPINKVVNTSTGTATCVDPSPALPKQTITTSVASDGSVTTEKTVTTAANGGGSSTQSSHIPASGSASPSSLTSGGGSFVSSYVPNCVDSQCTVKVDETGTPTADGALSTGDAAIAAAQTSAESLFSDLTGAGKKTDLGVTFSISNFLPSATSCTNWRFVFKDIIDKEVDWCPMLGRLRALWGWFFAAMLAIYMFKRGINDGTGV